MNGINLLIMLIVTVAITTIAAIVLTQVITDTQSALEMPQESTTVQLVNVIGQNISTDTIKHVRISVRTQGVLRINDTLIKLNTQTDSARLQYRNGTLNNSVGNGFYTQ